VGSKSWPSKEKIKLWCDPRNGIDKEDEEDVSGKSVCGLQGEHAGKKKTMLRKRSVRKGLEKPPNLGGEKGNVARKRKTVGDRMDAWTRRIGEENAEKDSGGESYIRRIHRRLCCLGGDTTSRGKKKIAAPSMGGRRPERPPLGRRKEFRQYAFSGEAGANRGKRARRSKSIPLDREKRSFPQVYEDRRIGRNSPKKGGMRFKVLDNRDTGLISQNRP